MLRALLIGVNFWQLPWLHLQSQTMPSNSRQS